MRFQKWKRIYYCHSIIHNCDNIEIIKNEKFYQKKVDVANGVIEMGKILCETKEKLPHGEWIPWLEDSRVNFKPNQAQRYMRIAKELGTNTSYQEVFDKISLNKLYELASAPEETRYKDLYRIR